MGGGFDALMLFGVKDRRFVTAGGALNSLFTQSRAQSHSHNAGKRPHLVWPLPDYF